MKTRPQETQRIKKTDERISDSLYDEWGQFTAIPNLIFDNGNIAKIGVDAFAVFSYLRFMTNRKKGYAFPSYDLMVKEIGITRQRVSNALKVLEEYGLLARKRQFSGVTHYFLKKPAISPTGGLMEEHPLVRQVDAISPTGGLPLVQQVDTNKTDLIKTDSIKTDKRMGAEAAPKSSGIFPDDDLPETEGTEVHSTSLEKLPEILPAADPPPPARRQTPKKGDIVDGMLKYSSQPGQVDVADYPEDVQAIIKAFCETFNHIPPSKGRKGSTFDFWIKTGRELQEACAEFGTSLLPEVKKVYPSHLVLSGPQSILKVARDQAAKRRASSPQELTVLEVSPSGWQKQSDGFWYNPKTGVQAVYSPEEKAAMAEKTRILKLQQANNLNSASPQGL